MEFYARLINKKIVAENDSDYTAIGKIKPNETYKFVLTRPRNYEFHKKYFALLNLAYSNQDDFNNFDEMRAWLTMKAGFYKRVQTPTGEMFQPESISFASMSADRFEEVYSMVMDQVCLWLDLSDDEIQQNVVNFM